jgi:hypothetical protein
MDKVQKYSSFNTLTFLTHFCKLFTCMPTIIYVTMLIESMAYFII